MYLNLLQGFSLHKTFSDVDSGIIGSFQPKRRDNGTIRLKWDRLQVVSLQIVYRLTSKQNVVGIVHASYDFYFELLLTESTLR